MFSQHPVAKMLTTMGAFNTTALDSAKPKPAPAAVLDAILLDAAEATNMRLDVAALFQEWCETTAEDLAQGETMGDRLFAMFVGLADEDKDGDLTPDEEALIAVAMETGLEYLLELGATEDDALALLNDGDNAAGDRVCELLKGALPDGEEASMDDIESFAGGGEADQPLFDSIMDAVYKKRVVVRGGRKVRINKRVAGTVRLSAQQKVSIKKARRKAHSATARMHRMKSMRVRARAGL